MAIFMVFDVFLHGVYGNFVHGQGKIRLLRP